jgi:AraC-like DNA-binding protein
LVNRSPLQSAELVWAICALAEQRAIPVDVLLREAGIPASLRTDTDARISLEKKMALVRALLARSGDPSVGVDVGGMYDPLAFHVVSVVSALLPTARDAMRLFAENAHMLDATFAISYFETPEEARIVFTDDELDLGELRRFYMDVHLAVVVCFWRSLRSDGRSGPVKEIWSRVDFDYARPAEASKYEAFFRCPVRFGVDVSGVAVDPSDDLPRNVPGSHHSDRAKKRLRQLAGDVAVDADMIAVVRRIVAVQVGVHHTLPRADEIAARLQISDRTLRDQLAKRDTSFREILERAVAQRAKFHLREGADSIGKIAVRVGYADASGFVRAFRRATGMTPNEYRESVEARPSLPPDR